MQAVNCSTGMWNLKSDHVGKDQCTTTLLFQQPLCRILLIFFRLKIGVKMPNSIDSKSHWARMMGALSFNVIIYWNSSICLQLRKYIVSVSLSLINSFTLDFHRQFIEASSFHYGFNFRIVKSMGSKIRLISQVQISEQVHKSSVNFSKFLCASVLSSIK